jgi:hypothetical protein
MTPARSGPIIHPAGGAIDYCKTSARLKFSNERRFTSGLARGSGLLGVNRPVIVGIGSLEALLDEREKFILVQSSVIIGVPHSEKSAQGRIHR